MKILLFIMLIIGLSFGFSISAIADDDVFYGCYKKNNGKLRKVADPDACKKSELPIVWNMVGATGAAGPKGDKGDVGATGAAGPKGDKGESGATGSAGPTGPAGKDGVNGTNGADGAVGPQGPVGPQGTDGGAGFLIELCELYSIVDKEFPEACFNCGNAEVEPMEECDDGNDDDFDLCTSDCLINDDTCEQEMPGIYEFCQAQYRECSDWCLDALDECVMLPGHCRAIFEQCGEDCSTETPACVESQLAAVGC